MGLFDTSLIEKEVHISLAENLLIDLCAEIETQHKDLISSMRSHGIDSVATCIDLIINQLRSSKKYKRLDVYPIQFNIELRNHKFVTVIKNNLYVVIGVKSVYYPYNTAIMDDENRGEVLITLDKYLRITKRKFKPYEHLWR